MKPAFAYPVKHAFAYLANLNLGALFFGPVFQKDVRVAGRRKGTYWIRALYTLMLGFILSIAFMSYTSNSAMYSGSAARLQQMQTLAPTIAITTIWTQFILLAFISPILTAGSICDEKRARTMSALMTTPLTSAQIVFGKLSSGLVQLTILTLISTPILLSVRIFGGLDTQIVLAATLAVMSTAVLGASLGVLYSCWNKHTSTVVVMALLSLALIQAAPIIITQILIMRGFLPSYQMPSIVMTTCSPVILVEASLNLTGNQGFTSMNQTIVPWTWTLWRTAIANAVYVLGMAGFVMLWATYALRRTMLLEAAGSDKLSRKERKTLRRLAAIAKDQPNTDQDGWRTVDQSGGGSEACPVQASSLRVASSSREVADQPVLWRELQQTGFSGKPVSISMRGFTLLAVSLVIALVIASFRVSDAHLFDFPDAIRAIGTNRFREALALLAQYVISGGIIVVALVRFRKGIKIKTTKAFLTYALVAAAVFSYLYIDVGFGHSGVHIFVGVILVLGTLIMASVKTASGIASEREARTWDVLLSTTLTGREIILGKFVGALKTQLILPALLIGHLVLATIFGAIHPIVIPQAMLIILGPIVFLSATGVLFSLLFKRTTVAGVCNMGLALTVWLGSWFALGVLSLFVDPWDNVFFEFMTNVNTALSPPAMIVAAADNNALIYNYGFNTHSSQTYKLFSEPLHHTAFSVVASAVFGLYCMMALGAITLAIRVFGNRSGRAS